MFVCVLSLFCLFVLSISHHILPPILVALRTKFRSPDLRLLHVILRYFVFLFVHILAPCAVVASSHESFRFARFICLCPCGWPASCLVLLCALNFVCPFSRCIFPIIIALCVFAVCIIRACRACLCVFARSAPCFAFSLSIVCPLSFAYCVFHLCCVALVVCLPVLCLAIFSVLLWASDLCTLRHLCFLCFSLPRCFLCRCRVVWSFCLVVPFICVVIVRCSLSYSDACLFAVSVAVLPVLFVLYPFSLVLIFLCRALPDDAVRSISASSRCHPRH